MSAVVLALLAPIAARGAPATPTPPGATAPVPGASNPAASPATAAAPAPPSPAGPPAPPAPAPREQRLEDSAEVERVISLYAGGRYEECAETLSGLLDPANKEALRVASAIERARLYHATCLLMNGQEEAAKKPLRDALERNPTMGTPDSLTFPPPLVRTFLTVKKEFLGAIQRRQRELLEQANRQAAEAEKRAAAERERCARLETLAQEEKLIVQSSRFLATVPFGVGQFQNGSDTLGYTFLIAEAAALATATTSLFLIYDQYKHLRLQITTQRQPTDVARNQQIAYATFVASSWALLGLMAGGITEAHLSFVAERGVVRQRPLPAEVQRKAPQAKSSMLLPVFSPVAGGGTLGLMGSF